MASNPIGGNPANIGNGNSSWMQNGWYGLNNAYNPSAWKDDPGKEANALIDPFNFSGWNKYSDPDPYGGMAQYPTYVGMDPSQLNISQRFMGPNDPMNKFAQESMRNGLSAGTQFALKQNQIGANNARDQASRMAQGGAADARAQLSMKGGLGAGANAMIGKGATNSALSLANAADANASGNRSNMLIADEAARTGNLQAASGMIQGQQKMGYDMQAGDLARQQAELDRQNAFKMGGYQSQMAAWGAGKQANATAHSGGKK